MDLADETLVSGLHLVGGPVMFVVVQVSFLGLEHEELEKNGKFADPMNRVDSGNLSRIFFAVLEAFTYSQVLAWLAHKENFAMLRIGGIGKQDENAFFLLDSRKVKQVGIRMDDECAVRIGREDVVSVDDGKRLRFEQLAKPLPVFLEK